MIRVPLQIPPLNLPLASRLPVLKLRENVQQRVVELLFSLKRKPKLRFCPAPLHA